MDAMSWMALGYCFTAGIEFNGIYAQVNNDPRKLTPRLIFISMFTMYALINLIAANAIFVRSQELCWIDSGQISC